MFRRTMYTTLWKRLPKNHGIIMFRQCTKWFCMLYLWFISLHWARPHNTTKSHTKLHTIVQSNKKVFIRLCGIFVNCSYTKSALKHSEQPQYFVAQFRLLAFGNLLKQQLLYEKPWILCTFVYILSTYYILPEHFQFAQKTEVWAGMKRMLLKSHGNKSEAEFMFMFFMTVICIVMPKCVLNVVE